MSAPVAETTRPALEAHGLSKHFDGVVALDEASLSVQPGEIHALLGENGAGKSTLIKVVTGVVAPDAGETRRDGRVVDFDNVRDAQHAGVVALYQELSVIPTISVAENILLGERTPRKGGIVKRRQLHEQAQRQLDRLNQTIPLRRLAGGLSPVQQTMVAVARALATDAKVLILDEPTASLTGIEIENLFGVLRSLRDDGVAIIYVSHRLEEVFELCDRLTVMRNGETIDTREVAEVTVNDVISMMVGRAPDQMFPARSAGTGEIVLQVENLTGARVRDVSFHIRAGEVLGVGGLAGSGRSEMLRLLAGAQRRQGGEVTVGGEPVRPGGGVGRSLDAGMALVPEERRSQGVIMDASIQNNIAVANLREVSRAGWMLQPKVTALAGNAMEDLRIKARGPRQHVGHLSGGNQQKVVLGKMLARRPKVLLLDEPTRGIDVGTKAEIYRLIRSLADSGTAVLVVSSELPELIGLSDRILVMHDCTVAGEVAAEDADEETLLSYYYGRTA